MVRGNNRDRDGRREEVRERENETKRNSQRLQDREGAIKTHKETVHSADQARGPNLPTSGDYKTHVLASGPRMFNNNWIQYQKANPFL